MVNMFAGIDLDEEVTDPVEKMTRVLMAVWVEKEPLSSVALYPSSYVATFVDMARAALDSLR